MRLAELEEREAELDRREASLVAEHDIREQRLEERERDGKDLEQRLAARETHLSSYVAQVQTQFANEGEWWAKQLGSSVDVPAA